MKIFAYLFILMLTLLSSCSTPTSPTNSSSHNKQGAITAPSHEHKMAMHFITSQKINHDHLVAKLIKKSLAEPTNTEPLYGLGYLHMESGITTKNANELVLAEAYLQEVLTQFPGNQMVLRALYNVYYDNTLRNRSPNARALAKAIFLQIPEKARSELNPPSLAKYGATVYAQESSRQTDRQALRDILLAAIQEAPQNETAYIKLAKLYSDDRYFPLALATLKMGEENNRSSADLYKAIAYTYVKRADVNGCNYEHPTDIQNSSKYYQLAIPLKPDDQALHFALSQAFLDQNRTQLGLYESTLALNINPTQEGLGLQAQHLSVLGYNTQAIATLQKAIAQGYSPSQAAFHEIYMNQGDWQKAAEGFNAYVKSHNKFSVYDVIKSDIIAQQKNLPAWPIAKYVATNNKWEQALLNYWQARISADALRKIALTRCEKAEFFFYSGYQDLQAGNTLQARTKFQAAMDQNTYRFIERPLARYFLQNN